MLFTLKKCTECPKFIHTLDASQSNGLVWVQYFIYRVSEESHLTTALEHWSLWPFGIGRMSASSSLLGHRHFCRCLWTVSEMNINVGHWWSNEDYQEKTGRGAHITVFSSQCQPPSSLLDRKLSCFLNLSALWQEVLRPLKGFAVLWRSDVLKLHSKTV
jgi:hypothetical protein